MIDLEAIGVPAFTVSVSCDGMFRYRAVNAVNEAWTGFTTAGLAGKTPHDLFAPDMAERLCEHYRACIEKRAVVDYEVAGDFPAGRSWWRASLIPMIGPSGAVETIVGVCNALSPERSHELELELANRHLDLAIRCLKGADWRFDIERGHYTASPNLALLMGEDTPRPVDWSEWAARVQAEDVAGTSCDVLLSGEAREQVVRFRFRNNRDEVRWAQCRRMIAAGETLAPVIFGVIVDVTDEHTRAIKLENEARCDSLTGLLNRRGFEQDLACALLRSAAKRPSLAVLMLDLDGFKPINDRLGHAAGDDVLVEVARRLAAAVGEDGIVARLGGDEFAVAIPGVDRAEAAALKMRLADAVSRSFRRQGEWIGICASIGLSWTSHAADVQAMLAEADHRLYREKHGRDHARRDPVDRGLDQMTLFAA